MFIRENLTYVAEPLPHREKRTDDEIAAAAKAFRDVMTTRHTVRDFSARAVPKSVIEDCIRTAGRAPSGANHQPWHFAAISSPSIKAQIRAAAMAETDPGTQKNRVAPVSEF